MISLKGRTDCKWNYAAIVRINMPERALLQVASPESILMVWPLFQANPVNKSLDIGRYEALLYLHK